MIEREERERERDRRNLDKVIDRIKCSQWKRLACSRWLLDGKSNKMFMLLAHKLWGMFSTWILMNERNSISFPAPMTMKGRRRGLKKNKGRKYKYGSQLSPHNTIYSTYVYLYLPCKKCDTLYFLMSF